MTKSKSDIHLQEMQKQVSLSRQTQKPACFQDESTDISDSEKGPIYKRRYS
jgi:hypothetical protein